jgi:hypothetical protein
MFQLCEARAVRAVFGRFLGGAIRRSDLRGQIWLLSRGVGQEHRLCPLKVLALANSSHLSESGANIPGNCETYINTH